MKIAIAKEEKEASLVSFSAQTSDVAKVTVATFAKQNMKYKCGSFLWFVITIS